MHSVKTNYKNNGFNMQTNADIIRTLRPMECDVFLEVVLEIDIGQKKHTFNVHSHHSQAASICKIN